uniref:FP protein C-terminal domain-containing protein n=1 Tax=Heliothis virescens TaxID=7102 RepID=A0A2A4J6R0_HELVI
MQSHADEQADIKKRINDVCLEGSKQSSLLIDNLVSKIDSLEQQARNCNAEICNVPEKRGENLLNIIEMVGSAVNFPICQRDIVSIHRVQHATQQGNKPKNIVVKFNSRILRDNLVSAYRLSKTLKAEQIGFPGSTATIYINEHLTLKNKQLFRKTREAAASHNYKYVWIKNSTILVRKRDDTSTFAIRIEDDIRKIKGKDDNIEPSSARENN